MKLSQSSKNELLPLVFCSTCASVSSNHLYISCIPFVCIHAFLFFLKIKYAGETMTPIEATEKKCTDENKVKTSIPLVFSILCSASLSDTQERKDPLVRDERGTFLVFSRKSQKSNIELTSAVSPSSP